jgi:hypothetical protein
VGKSVIQLKTSVLLQHGVKLQIVYCCSFVDLLSLHYGWHRHEHRYTWFHGCKMVLCVELCTLLQMCSVIWFFTAEGDKPGSISCCILVVYDTGILHSVITQKTMTWIFISENFMSCISKYISQNEGHVWWDVLAWILYLFMGDEV